MILPFVHPSTFLLAGPTGSGKTYFVSRILKERLITPFPTRIIWVYSEWQPAYELLRICLNWIEFIKGPISPKLYENILASQRNLLVLDDQMTETGKTSQDLSKLFVQGSHHKNLSVIYLVQNLFDKGKQHRTVSLNSHYTIIFKNPRDNIQPGVLGRQMFPHKWKEFVEAYNDATSKSYGYIVLDFRQETEENLRVRTNIFPSDSENTEIYLIGRDTNANKKSSV